MSARAPLRKGQVGQSGNKGQFAKSVFAEAEEHIDFTARAEPGEAVDRDEALDRLERSEFFKEKGHINVPQRQSWGDWHAGHWVMRLRMVYREGKLSHRHIKRAEKLGIRWEPESKRVTIDEGLSRLEEVAQTHDVNRLPKNLDVDGWKPRRWVDNLQRSHMRGSLSADQITKAEHLGLRFKSAPAAIPAAIERQWRNSTLAKQKIRALELSEHYRKYGTIGFMSADDRRSPEGQFLLKLRKQYHAGTLSPEVIAEAEKRGFDWGTGPQTTSAAHS
jgi:hypothetical protein